MKILKIRIYLIILNFISDVYSTMKIDKTINKKLNTFDEIKNVKKELLQLLEKEYL